MLATVVVSSVIGVGALGSAGVASAAGLPGFKCDGKSHTGGTIGANYWYTPLKKIGGSTKGWVYKVEEIPTMAPLLRVYEVWCYA
jgi:hypothetical protein